MARSQRQNGLERHVAQLLQCRRCPRMKSTPVSGGAIASDVMIIGQAPGPREPVLQRPFAHTAGKTLFRWFEEFCRMDEAAVRSKIYFAAVCRCFPGKNSGGTDRVPAPDEIRNCSSWMDDEIASGASPWHKIAPGKELLGRALKLIARHPAVAALCEGRMHAKTGECRRRSQTAWRVLALTAPLI